MGHLSYRLRYSQRWCLLHFPLILSQVQEAQGPVVATNSGGCEEEWVLEHHSKKTKKGDAVTSDAETSGGEASGKEGPRRRKESKLTPFALCSWTVLRAKLLQRIDKGGYQYSPDYCLLSFATLVLIM